MLWASELSAIVIDDPVTARPAPAEPVRRTPLTVMLVPARVRMPCWRGTPRPLPSSVPPTRVRPRLMVTRSWKVQPVTVRVPPLGVALTAVWRLAGQLPAGGAGGGARGGGGATPRGGGRGA